MVRTCRVPQHSKNYSGHILVILTSLVVIVQSENIVSLLKDFTALTFVSEIDNLIFFVSKQGYFGSSLKKRSERVEKLKILEGEDKPIEVVKACVFVIALRFLTSIMVLFSIMFGTWFYIVEGQRSAIRQILSE